MAAKGKQKIAANDGIIRFPRVKRPGLSKSLSGLLTAMNRKFEKRLEGQKACIFSESLFAEERIYVPTGILPLDMALGGNGWPSGTVEIFGKESCGKSAVLEKTLAAAQERSFITALFEIERTLHTRRAATVGLNPEKLIMLPGRTVEDIYEVTRNFIRGIREEEIAEGRNAVPIVIGWDSVAATKTRNQLDMKHQLGDGMAEQARRLSEFFQVLADELLQYKALLILVNQTRMSIGKRHGGRISAGGTAIPYYCGVRCSLYIEEQIKNSEGEIVGALVNATLIKNKFFPPFRSVSFPIYWDRGIDADAAIWHYMVEGGLIARKGRLGYEFQGRPITKKAFQKILPLQREQIVHLIKEGHDA